MRAAVISRCGMLIAPLTCPFAKELGPRTSTTMKSLLADLRLSCTSQQSVSKASISSKCFTASADGAAGVSVTCVLMGTPVEGALADVLSLDGGVLPSDWIDKE